jgi:outer membrane biosynthesis protein TonB
MRRRRPAPPPHRAGPAPWALAAAASLLLTAGCPAGDDDWDDGDEGRPLSAAEVGRVLAGRDADVEGCIARARTRNASLSGRVEVAGTVGTDGRVKEARIASSTAGDAMLEDCILGEVRVARFPEASAETGFERGWTLGAARRAPAAAPEIDVFADSDAPAGDAPAAATPFRREAVTELARREGPAIQACYEAEAQGDPDLAGRVNVAWAVDPSGAVRSVVVTSSTLENEAVESCIVRNIQGWRFEAPGGAGMHQASHGWSFSQERVEAED